MSQFQNECIFITYEDVIKTFKPFVLQRLMSDEYRNNYKDFIDFTNIDGKNYDQLLTFCTATRHRNILQAIAKQDFDFESTYNDLYYTFDDIVKDSPTLLMGSNLVILLNQLFVNKVYIYTENYDERIRNDVSYVYKDTTKMEYISGDFKEVVNSIDEKITSFILNDINRINDLIDIDKISYTNILVLDIGYNYNIADDYQISFKIDNLEQLSRDKIFKLGFFKQFELPNKV